MRAFIAIELNSAIKDELTKVQSELKSSGADLKRVDPKAMHLTLKFLGEVSDDKIEEVKDILNRVSSQHSKFELSLFKLGGFPTLKVPRVIWVGLDKGCSQAEAIAGELEEALTQIGFAKEKKSFSAHLTLGRVRSNKGKQKLLKMIDALVFKPSASSTVDKITLFQSKLTTQGAIHTPLHQASFN